MIVEYIEMLKKCATQNQVNALHIEFENSMTPQEMFEIINVTTLAQMSREARAALIAAKQSEPRSGQGFFGLGDALGAIEALSPTYQSYIDNWGAAMGRFMLLGGDKIAEPYRRKRMSKYVSLYSAGGDTGQKCLAICFAGAGQRIMMPVGVFLQQLPADRYDVVVLRDVNRNGYRTGIPGVATSLEELVDRVGASQRRLYRSVVSLGVSAGGLPAIWAALQLGLDKGVSVGGNHPFDERWQLWGEAGIKQPFSQFLARLKAVPDLLLVHGADEARDIAAARALSELLPTRTVAVERHDGVRSGHNALYALLQRGTLAPFLEQAISLSPSWDDLVALAIGAPSLAVAAGPQATEISRDL